MILGRVVGNVVATQKHGKLDASKLLLVQPRDAHGHDVGLPLLTVDTVGAGAGEIVLVVVEGKSTSQAMAVDRAPVDAAIVGIVDTLELDAAALESTATAEES